MGKDELFKDAREKFAGVLAAVVSLVVFLQGLFPDVLGGITVDMELLQLGVDFVTWVVVALVTAGGAVKVAKIMKDRDHK